MKKILVALAVMTFCAGVYAQTAVETGVEFDKKKVNSVAITYNDFGVDLVKGALQARMEKVAALKGSNAKGWRAYLAQPFPEIGNMNFDIYTMVTEVGKKKDKATVVYMLVSKGNENFISSSTDPEIIENVKNFLSNFTAYVREYSIQLKIKEQEGVGEKLKKEYDSMTSDRDKMKSQIKDLEKKISAKEDDMQKKQEEIKKAEEVLQEHRNSLK